MSFEDSLDVGGFAEDAAEGERAHSLAQEGRERQATAGGGHCLELGLRAPMTDDISICINDFHPDTEQLVAVPGQEFEMWIRGHAECGIQTQHEWDGGRRCGCGHIGPLRPAARWV